MVDYKGFFGITYKGRGIVDFNSYTCEVVMGEGHGSGRYDFATSLFPNPPFISIR